MIHELSENCQFITTTFRPEMLANADQFYGVTYDSKVSQITRISKESALDRSVHQGATAGGPEEETQAHFFKCKQGDLERGEKDWGGRETKMVAEKYLDSRNAFIGLMEVVHRALQLAALLDWSEHSKREAAPTTATKTTAALSLAARKKLINKSRAETIKRVCRAKIEWEYQRWKARCEAQIDWEEGS
ncbi:Structural maintenance of chromosomes protein 3 [Spiromyces aspiralis]|uniref:Structural maintenance of chromosomes protein 3 n=1 Tax=Spiromyces aspiralis TaxID=68401 RepID=A0ACC1HPJ2_9FUNG|nr:Structural maintenance of chromosomes protein 3 [Spiromyces aspiralis]